MYAICLTRWSEIAGAVRLALSANQSKLLHSWALWVSCGQILGLYNFEISGFAVDFQLTKISNRHWLSTADPLTLLTVFARCIAPQTHSLDSEARRQHQCCQDVYIEHDQEKHVYTSSLGHFGSSSARKH